jgi:pimeloyl-ACP methyl ester carboxylesterase
VPTATPEPTRGFRGTIALADGRKLAASCAGTGTPTVFLEGGGLTPSISDWPASLISDLAEITTVCRYSRAGAEGSSPAQRPRAWADVLADADQLLAGLHDVAGVDGPYIFLGWSLGGSFALGEVVEDPSRVAGMVILDTDFPVDFLAVCPLTGRSKADCQAEYDGDLEAKLIEGGIARSIKPLPNIPVRVITAMRNPECLDPAPGATLTASIGGVQLTAKDCASMIEKVADKMATDWGMLSPDFEQIRVQGSHDELPGFAHARIAQVIGELVAAARAKS